MLNISVLALRVAQFSMIPTFSHRQNMFVSRSHFYKFGAPVFFQNNVLKMEKSSFTNGLSSAIVAEADSWADETGQKEVAIKDLTFINVRDQEKGVIDGLWKSVSIEHALFSNCHNDKAKSTTHFESSGPISISYTCFFNCTAVENSGIKINGLDTKNDQISIDTVTAVACDASSAVFSFAGAGYTIYRLNTSTSSSCGLEVIRTHNSTLASDASYGAIENCDCYCGIFFGVGEGITASQTKFAQFQIRNNTINGQGLIRLAIDVNIHSCYFFDNAITGEPFTTGGSATDATILKCFMDIPSPQIFGIKFSACIFNNPYANPQTFYGMNTYGCEAIEEKYGIDNFFKQFSSEELICTIIVSIALVTAIIQAIVLLITFMKERRLARYNADEYDDNMEYDYYSDYELEDE